jgi:hypothetical protein
MRLVVLLLVVCSSASCRCRTQLVPAQNASGYVVLIVTCPDGVVAADIGQALTRCGCGPMTHCDMGGCGIYVPVQDERAARRVLAGHEEWAEFVLPHSSRWIEHR